MEEMMPDYYELIDGIEQKKIDDKARITLS